MADLPDFDAQAWQLDNDVDGSARDSRYRCGVLAAALRAAHAEGSAQGEARGLERAAAEAENTDLVEDRDSYYAQLGDAGATRKAIVAAIRALAQPPLAEGKGEGKR